METQPFAAYRDREIAVTYFNGAGYVVRHQQYPRTHFTQAGPVTRQGHSMLVGIRQGTSDESGFACQRYTRPDTDPHRASTSQLPDNTVVSR